jgi:hypothetical protein
VPNRPLAGITNRERADEGKPPTDGDPALRFCLELEMSNSHQSRRWFGRHPDLDACRITADEDQDVRLFCGLESQ